MRLDVSTALRSAQHDNKIFIVILRCAHLFGLRRIQPQGASNRNQISRFNSLQNIAI